jgi:hypothetical protein
MLAFGTILAMSFSSRETSELYQRCIYVSAWSSYEAWFWQKRRF